VSIFLSNDGTAYRRVLWRWYHRERIIENVGRVLAEEGVRRPVVARRARCVWAREDDDDGDDDDARAMRVFHDDDDDGSTIERGQGTRTTTRVRWDGWVTDDDGSSVHPSSSVQLSIGDRGVEPPDRARAWRGWNGADVGPVVDPDAKDERRARSNGGGGMRGYANGWPSESGPPFSEGWVLYLFIDGRPGPSGRRRPGVGARMNETLA